MSDWLGVVGGALILTGFGLGKKYFSGGANTHNPDLHGKVVIVTGSNTGIGYETASKLSELGAHVVLACRDKSRATDAIQSIQKKSKKNVSLEFIPLDLTNKQSIVAFAKDFKAKHPKLNILINNAGVMAIPKKMLTKDGFEMQIGVNHFGHFLLTSLLLESLKAGAPSRVVNVSSRAHIRAKFDINDLFYDKRPYQSMPVYSSSKLANIFFTYEFNKRYADQGITAYSLHPGVVITELSRYILEGWKAYLAIPLYPIAWYFAKNPTQGAQTSLYCALAPGLEKDAGKYFADCKVKEPAPFANDPGLAKKLWEKTEEIWGITFGQDL